MSREQAIQAIEAGASVLQEQITAGLDVLATGDMGIGNTTPSAAIAVSAHRAASGGDCRARHRRGRCRLAAKNRGDPARPGNEPA